MSLVHEALLKAARERQRKSGVYAPPPAQPVAGVHPVSRGEASVPAPASVVAPSPAAAKLPFALVASAIASVAAVAIVAIVLLVMRSSTPPVAVAKEPAPVSRTATPPEPPVSNERPALTPSEPVAAAPSVPAPAPKLSGIMTDPDGKLCAVLDGRVAYEGYVINGVTVKKIERDRLTIEIGGQESVLRLF